MPDWYREELPQAELKAEADGIKKKIKAFLETAEKDRASNIPQQRRPAISANIDWPGVINEVTGTSFEGVGSGRPGDVLMMTSMGMNWGRVNGFAGQVTLVSGSPINLPERRYPF